MKAINIIPEKEQKTLWFIAWGIPFALGVVICLVLLIFVDKLPVMLSLGGWLILMLPIAIYIPAYYRSLEYIIDTDDIRIISGVFWKKRITIPYPKITNIDITQGPVQRMYNVGIIHIQTAGAGGPQGAQAEMILVGIKDLEGLKSTIMERFRSNSGARVEEVKKEVAVENSTDILQQILQELTAIREVLKQK
jgi:membrane protein YdbS with pleckstrin-like domain